MTHNPLLLSVRDLAMADRLTGVSFDIRPGECVGLIGPNGAGKSTLLKTALGLLPGQGHSSLLDVSPAVRARHVAYLPQSHDVAWPITVEMLVMLGRQPHLAPGHRAGAADRAVVRDALRAVGLTGLRHRPATELSGGQRVLALVARLLAQQAPLILADEPVAGLDPRAQLQVMHLLMRHARHTGHAVVASLHDLSLAQRCCDRLILLRAGRLLADGPPDHVLTDDNLQRAFGVRVARHDGPDGRHLTITDIVPGEDHD